MLVSGRAVVREDPNVGGAGVPMLREMVERDWGERGVRCWAQTLEQPRWLVFVEPVKVTSWSGTWAQRYRHYMSGRGEPPRGWRSVEPPVWTRYIGPGPCSYAYKRTRQFPACDSAAYKLLP